MAEWDVVGEEPEGSGSGWGVKSVSRTRGAGGVDPGVSPDVAANILSGFAEEAVASGADREQVRVELARRLGDLGYSFQEGQPLNIPVRRNTGAVIPTPTNPWARPANILDAVGVSARPPSPLGPVAPAGLGAPAGYAPGVLQATEGGPGDANPLQDIALATAAMLVEKTGGKIDLLSPDATAPMPGASLKTGNLLVDAILSQVQPRLADMVGPGLQGLGDVIAGTEPYLGPAAGATGRGLSSLAAPFTEIRDVARAEEDARRQAAGQMTLAEENASSFAADAARVAADYAASSRDRLSPGQGMAEQEFAQATSGDVGNTLEFLLDPRNLETTARASAPSVISSLFDVAGAGTAGRIAGLGRSGQTAAGISAATLDATELNARAAAQKVLEDGGSEEEARKAYDTALAMGLPANAAIMGLGTRAGLNPLEEAISGGRPAIARASAAEGKARRFFDDAKTRGKTATAAGGKEAFGEFPQGASDQVISNVATGAPAFDQAANQGLVEAAAGAPVASATNLATQELARPEADAATKEQRVRLSAKDAQSAMDAQTWQRRAESEPIPSGKKLRARQNAEGIWEAVSPAAAAPGERNAPQDDGAAPANPAPAPQAPAAAQPSAAPLDPSDPLSPLAPAPVTLEPGVTREQIMRELAEANTDGQRSTAAARLAALNAREAQSGTPEGQERPRQETQQEGQAAPEARPATAAQGATRLSEVGQAKATRRFGIAANGVSVVASAADIAPDVAARNNLANNSDAEGFFDEATGQVYVIDENLDVDERRGWTIDGRRAWVIAHEGGHRGLRAYANDMAKKAGPMAQPARELATILARAGQNDTISMIARRIAGSTERQGEGLSNERAVDEALAEAMAAVVNDNYAELETRYRVQIPQAMRNTLRGYVTRLVEKVRNLFRASGSKVSDAEIYELLTQMRKRFEDGRVEGIGRGQVMSRRAQDDELPEGLLDLIRARGNEIGKESTPEMRRTTPHDQVDTAEFKRWFRNSKVVDDLGRPLVAYHGTTGDFDSFDMARGGSVYGASDSKGVMYFSTSAVRPWSAGDDAAAVAGGERIPAPNGDPDGTVEGSVTMPVFLRVENPKIVNGVSISASGIKKAKQAGHDGVFIMRGEGDDGSMDVIVFSPEQVKSASANRGAFDDSASITASRRELIRDNPFEVSTRSPSAKRTKKFTPEDSMANLLISDFASGLGQERWLASVAELVEEYPNYRHVKSATTPEEKLERLVRHMVDNLLWLHDQVPAEIRERSKLWYDGANAIAKRWAKKYKISVAQAAGVLAVLSPQKDWFMNISLAERVLDTMMVEQTAKWSDKMSATADRIFGNGDYQEDLAEIRGKPLRDIDDLYLKGMWVRIYDQANNPASYQVYSPEGSPVGEAKKKKKKGQTEADAAKAAWGGISTIAKAISIFEDGSVANISAMLGRKHKVRNFYNNILAPNSKNGHVTIDTHAVAAALLRALSGNSLEVKQNFGGPKSAHAGLEGTYPLFEEAYRRAAEARGILPREMQSITWEAIRGMYVPGFKSQASNVAAVDAVWNRYKRGRITHEQAQREVLALAGGIDPPSWSGRDTATYVEDEPAADEGDVFEDGIPGRNSADDARATRKRPGTAPRITASRRAIINVGLDIPGGGRLTHAEVKAAVTEAGAKIISSNQHRSDSEDTLVIEIEPPLTPEAMDSLSASLRQEAIPQRMEDGSGELYGPKAEDWGPYNPSYFLMPDGSRADKITASRRAVTDTPEFKAWFGDSKVVNEDGSPKVMYHGTFANFTEPETLTDKGGFGFHVGNMQQAEDVLARKAPNGSWLRYKRDTLREGSLNMPVYVKAERPMRLPDLGNWHPSLVLDAMKEGGYISAKKHARLVDEINEEEGSFEFVAAVQDAIISAGYDSVVYLNKHEGLKGGFRRQPSGDSYIVFDPRQIKSATGNSGAFDPTNPSIIASKRAKPFYSALTRSIEQGKGAPSKASADQWKGWLDGAMRRGEFKQAERDWLGLDAWLDSKDGKVSRDEIAAFVRMNEVDVTETVLGEGPSTKGQLRVAGDAGGNFFVYLVFDEDSSEVVGGPYKSRGDAELALDDMLSKEPPKFANFQLPGGTNYRELLLTLPSDAPVSMRDQYQLIDREDDGRVISVGDEDVARRWRVQWADDLASGALTIERKQVPGQKQPAGVFTSSHFDQPNILAHVRFNERTDADGKRVLFIEEIQSDWHQKGRKDGYAADPQSVMAKLTSENAAPEIVALAGMKASQGVPDAPFKKEWPMLAFKRMVRWAAENGFDSIAWTTGEQQAERYDLSKLVSSITAYKDIDGTFKLSMIRVGERTSGPVVTVKNEAELEAMVGKDLAKKIAAQEAFGAKDSIVNYSGLDLKVGGEGMRGFYDKILPAEVNKWAKAFGGKVEWLGLPVPKGMVSPIAVFHSMPVTPAMRDAAMAGLPMFSKRAPSFNAKKQKKDAVSALGVHYGKVAGLKELDPRMAGTAAAGAERRRFGVGQYGLQGGTAARLGFYVWEDGEPMPKPESVVTDAGGTTPYMVNLTNLYDLENDPLELSSANRDAMEEEISDAGYDGYLAGRQPGIDSRVAVVFDIGKKKIPVAPATGGTFSRRTPAQAAAQRTGLLSRLAASGFPLGSPTQSPTGQFSRLTDTVDRVREELQDKMLRARRLTESVTTQDVEDFYTLENMMFGKVRDTLEQYERDYILKLQNGMKRLGVSMEQMSDYLLARHAEERNRRIASINPLMPDAGSGITTADAQGVLAGTVPGPYSGKVLSADVRRDAAVLARLVDGMRDETLKMLVASGRITPQLEQTLRSTYKHYVPLRGKDDIEPWMEFGPSRGRGLNVGATGIQRAGGRGAGNLPQNIVGEVVGDLQRAAVNAGKAEVLQSFLKFALAHPMPGVYEVEQVQLEWKFDKNTGEVYLGVKRAAEDDNRSVLVPYKGSVVRVVFNDERLARAMTNLGQESLAAFVKWFGVINRWRSAVLTRYNPGFAPVNIVRDAIFGLTAIASEQGAKVAAESVKNYAQAMAALLQDSYNRTGDSSVPDARKTMADWAVEFAEQGVKTGMTMTDDVIDLQKRLSVASTTLMQLAFGPGNKGPLNRTGRIAVGAKEAFVRAGTPIVEAIEHFNDASENAIRLAVYIAMRQRGDTKHAAAKYAKNVTINFNRKGFAGPAVNAIFLFYNAAVQGSHAVFRVMKKPAVAGFLAGLAGFQYMAALSMMGDDDDDGVTEWDKVPKYVRETSLVIPLYGRDGKSWVSIPMPYGFNIVTFGAGRLAQWVELGARPTDGSLFLDMVNAGIGAFSPIPINEQQSMMGETVGFLMSLAANKDDLGRPITNENPWAPYDTPAAIQGKATTPAIFVSLSQMLAKAGGADLEERKPPVAWLDRSPEELEQIYGFLTGGLGNIASKSMRWWEQFRASTMNDPLDYVTTAPILSRFVGQAGGQTEARAIAERYYGEAGEFQRHLDVMNGKIARGEDPEAVLAERQAQVPALEGVELARYKRPTEPGKMFRGGLAGDVKVTQGGKVQFKPGTDSALSSLKSAKQAVEDLNGAITQLRSPDMTIADALKIVDSVGEASGPGWERQAFFERELGLEPGYNGSKAAPTRVRTRAIKLLQEQRQKAQQAFLIDLEETRRD